jgi:cytochrome c553
MSRLIIFLSMLVGFVLILTLSTYKNLPVSNEKFDFQKASAEHSAYIELIKKVTAPKEENTQEEVVTTVAAPKIELNTPELVSGEKVYAKCIACHGNSGEGKPSQKAAHIGGQYDWYIEKQLTDMKHAVRVNEAMNPTLKGLSEKDIKDVAAYITKLPWKKIN